MGYGLLYAIFEMIALHVFQACIQDVSIIKVCDTGLQLYIFQLSVTLVDKLFSLMSGLICFILKKNVLLSKKSYTVTSLL